MPGGGRGGAGEGGGGEKKLFKYDGRSAVSGAHSGYSIIEIIGAWLSMPRAKNNLTTELRNNFGSLFIGRRLSLARRRFFNHATLFDGLQSIHVICAISCPFSFLRALSLFLSLSLFLRLPFRAYASLESLGSI